jgi:hypothetical protein
VIAHHMLSHMKLPRSLFWEQLGRQVLVASILAGLIVASKMFVDPGSLIALAVIGGLNCIVAWVLSGAIILSGSDRAMFGRFARAMTPRSQ